MANGFPGAPGQPPVGPPIPFGTRGVGGPPGGLPAAGLPPSVGPPPGLFGLISQLAAKERPNALDKIRQAVDLLEESRDLDPKSANAISMALHVLRNGRSGLSDFESGSPGKFPEGKLGAGGVVGGV